MLVVYSYRNWDGDGEDWPCSSWEYCGGWCSGRGEEDGEWQCFWLVVVCWLFGRAFLRDKKVKKNIRIKTFRDEDTSK